MMQSKQNCSRIGRKRSGFTLVELLVVVSIIALLISILLPSLKSARDSAKAVACGATLRGLGNGMQAYLAEEKDWIPGYNTSGVTLVMKGTDPNVLQNPKTPVQTSDWMTPFLSRATGLPNNRAKKFRTLRDEYKCASVGFKAGLYAGANAIDENLFEAEVDAGGKFFGGSYLMPVYFQMWGKEDKEYLGTGSAYIPKYTKVPPDIWGTVSMDRYKSRVDRVGTPADKIAAADGTRYLDKDGILSFDYTVEPNYFGAFTTSGAFWRGSTAYGDGGESGNVGGASAPKGRQLPLTYRHNDKIEVLFFDAHVERLSMKQSHKPDYWYPRGTVVEDETETFQDYAFYPSGYVIR